MKISIVTISFNQAKFLRECIDSVLNQDYQDVEYIVVDPGSTDGSRKIIDSYGDRIIKCYEKDNGPADGLNKGFSLATGDILGYINSDDFFLDTALKQVNEIFIKHKNLDLVYGNGFIVDEKGFVKKLFISTDYSQKRLELKQFNIFQQGTFFTKKIFDRTTGFNTNNKRTWDFELFLNMQRENINYLRVNNFFGALRIYPGTITYQGNKKIREKHWHGIYLKYYSKKISFIDEVIRIGIYLFDRTRPVFLFSKILSIYYNINKKKLN